MNIKRAKQEIRDSIEAYLSKDEFGEYRIPAIRQRPILLMGPPGIGKTAVMEQVVKALQSVVSLPLQLDSSHADALERGLRVYNGKPLRYTQRAMKPAVRRLKR